MSRVLLVQGLGYGDEGKGSIVSFLSRQHSAKLVIRFNGGAQAGHNVVTDDGRSHRFSQFGSGTFEGSRTFLSRFMLFNPITLLSEAKHLESIGVRGALSLLDVEKTALVTSPFHMAANRIREILRGGGLHGSCGMGIGETQRHALLHPSEALRVMDMEDPEDSAPKLQALRDRLIRDLLPRVHDYQRAGGEFTEQLRTELEILVHDSTIVADVAAKYGEVYKKLHVVGSEWLHEQLIGEGTFIFEGAQGVLLDQDFGWHPHTTWSDCTFGNADRLIGHFLQAGSAVESVTRIGVLRGYMTRHGAGPFVTEDKTLADKPGEANTQVPWQHNFRLGHFDPIAARYALDVVRGVDQIALTCLDHLADAPIRTCSKYTTNIGEQRALIGLEPHRMDKLAVNPIEPEERHLVKQEETTKVLGFLKPFYETHPDVDSFIASVEKSLDAPVKIASFGPKTGDKRER